MGKIACSILRGNGYSKLSSLEVKGWGVGREQDGDSSDCSSRLKGRAFILSHCHNKLQSRTVIDFLLGIKDPRRLGDLLRINHTVGWQQLNKKQIPWKPQTPCFLLTSCLQSQCVERGVPAVVGGCRHGDHAGFHPAAPALSRAGNQPVECGTGMTGAA